MLRYEIVLATLLLGCSTSGKGGSRDAASGGESDSGDPAPAHWSAGRIEPTRAWLHPREPKDCLTSGACLNNADCEGGERCNSALASPRCQTVLCAGVGDSCDTDNSDDLCQKGLLCAESGYCVEPSPGLLEPCDASASVYEAGSGQCSLLVDLSCQTSGLGDVVGEPQAAGALSVCFATTSEGKCYAHDILCQEGYRCAPDATCSAQCETPRCRAECAWESTCAYDPDGSDGAVDTADGAADTADGADGE